MTLVDELRDALGQRDTARVLELVERSPIEAWFAVPPADLLPVLLAAPADLMHTYPAVAALRTFGNLADDPAAITLALEDLGASTGNDAHFTGSVAAAILALRVRGTPRHADEVAHRYGDAARASNSLFDRTSGSRTFLALQRAITAALVGDDARALEALDLAQRLSPPESLTALLRDSHVKAALIEALHGDPTQAQAHLDTADRLPRTASWVEHVVDAHASMTRAALTTDPAEALRLLARVPDAAIGEFWPFQVEAVIRAHLRAGQIAEAELALHRYALSAPPVRAGEGLAGSTLALWQTIIALHRGNLAAARTSSRDLDPLMPVTGLVLSSIDIAIGESARAAQRLVALHPQTRMLRTREAGRIGLLAWALLTQDKSIQARDVLTQWRDERGLTDNDLEQFPDGVIAFAESYFPDWPIHNSRAPHGVSGLVEFHAALTERERAVLALLATDRTRAQIARDLFVSENTVKTQLRSLFRKLNVDTRADAVIAAHRRGLL